MLASRTTHTVFYYISYTDLESTTVEKKDTKQY